MHAMRTAVVVAVLFALAACESNGRDFAPQDAQRALFEPFFTATDEVRMIRVQDEFRLIRKIKRSKEDVAIEGSYEDILRIERAHLSDQHDSPYKWNTWYAVPSIRGLEFMFLTPDRVAFRQRSGSSR